MRLWLASLESQDRSHSTYHVPFDGIHGVRVISTPQLGAPERAVMTEAPRGFLVKNQTSGSVNGDDVFLVETRHDLPRKISTCYSVALVLARGLC